MASISKKLALPLSDKQRARLVGFAVARRVKDTLENFNTCGTRSEVWYIHENGREAIGSMSDAALLASVRGRGSKGGAFFRQFRRAFGFSPAQLRTPEQLFFLLGEARPCRVRFYDIRMGRWRTDELAAVLFSSPTGAVLHAAARAGIAVVK